MPATGPDPGTRVPQPGPSLPPVAAPLSPWHLVLSEGPTRTVSAETDTQLGLLGWRMCPAGAQQAQGSSRSTQRPPPSGRSRPHLCDPGWLLSTTCLISWTTPRSCRPRVVALLSPV